MTKVLKDLIKFSIPIILGQLGIILIGVGDVYIASKHSTLTVAAIGVATGVYNPIFLFGIGMMTGISACMAIRRGKGEGVENLLATNLYYATISAVVLTFVMLGVNQFVPYMGIEKELVPLIQEYIQIVSWSFLPAYYYQAVKEFLQSFENVIVANVISIIAVGLNLVVNYILVFGLFGLPAMGVKGLAVASLLTRSFMCFSIIFYARGYLKSWFIDNEFVKRVFKFSVPVAIMFFLEVLAFCLVAILVGGINTFEAAANNIIMNLASVTFMVPLSISNAVAVKVGAGYGAKSLSQIKQNTKAGLILSVTFMCCSAIMFWLIPDYLMKLFSTDQKVIFIGIQILAIVAMFQIVDGIQVTLNGVLRGLDKTFASSVLVFIGYWILGIPIGTWLCFSLGQNAKGLWIGLALSLAIVAFSLAFLYRKEIKKVQFQS